MSRPLDRTAERAFIDTDCVTGINRKRERTNERTNEQITIARVCNAFVECKLNSRRRAVPRIIARLERQLARESDVVAYITFDRARVTLAPTYPPSNVVWNFFLSRYLANFLLSLLSVKIKRRREFAFVELRRIFRADVQRTSASSSR